MQKNHLLGLVSRCHFCTSYSSIYKNASVANNLYSSYLTSNKLTSLRNLTSFSTQPSLSNGRNLITKTSEPINNLNNRQDKLVVCQFSRNFSTLLRSRKMASTETIQNGGSLLNGAHEQKLKDGGTIVSNKWRHSYSVPNGELTQEDKDVYEIMLKEKRRQRNEIELIASENFASKSVLQVINLLIGS